MQNPSLETAREDTYAIDFFISTEIHCRDPFTRMYNYGILSHHDFLHNNFDLTCNSPIVICTFVSNSFSNNEVCFIVK